MKELVRKEPEEYMNQFWVCFNVGAGAGMADIVRGLEKLSQGEKDKLLGLSACALFAIDPSTRKQVRRQGL